MKLAVPSATVNLVEPVIGRVTTRPVMSRTDTILVTCDASDLDGYAAILWQRTEPPVTTVPVAYAFRDLDYLADGDVVTIGRGLVRTLYRRDSPHNTILLTNQCNSYCLMCSQPPKRVNDRRRMHEHLALVRLMDPPPNALGITGGEPTLFGDDFLRLITACRDYLPSTALHVLSNGRSFFYKEFAQRLGRINHPDLMVGIPVYAATDTLHDYVVQSPGAFEETIIGLLHLNDAGVPIEIRIVMHRATAAALPLLAEFIIRNLTFAAQVAIMGLEPTGFATANMHDLWIDPLDYQGELQAAVEALALAGMNVRIYNHQLCVIPASLWPFAVRSISDWKNVYHHECGACDVRDQCGGFFASSSARRSRAIRTVSRVR